MTLRSMMLFAILIACDVSLVHADTWYVDAQLSGSTEAGDAWTTAFLHLQDALDNPGISEGDEVWVADGVYRPTATFPDPNDPNDRFSTFVLPKGVGVYGGFKGVSAEFPLGEALRSLRNPQQNLTVLDGNINDPNDASDNSYHVVYIRNTFPTQFKTTLSGFTVRNGYADGPGNESTGGGILEINFGDNAGHDAPVLNSLVIEHNYADGGGAGARINGGKITYMTNCVFRDNFSVSGNGGGLLRDGTSATNIVLQNCVFFRNVCKFGDGGGAFGRAVLINCTFSGNSSASIGAAYKSSNIMDPRGEMINCVVWGHEAQAIAGLPKVVFSNIEGGLPVGVFDTSLGWLNYRNNMSADPEFVDADAGKLALRGCSPSIDAGIDIPFGATNDAISPDHTDLNDNTNFTEITPWDAKWKFARIITNPTSVPGYNDPLGDPNDPNDPDTIAAFVDMGAFELCLGDIDGNGVVGLPDLATLLTCFGGTPDCTAQTGCCAADLTCDNLVGLPDLATLLANFGSNCVAATGTAGGGEGLMSGPSDSDAALRDWLQSATIEEIMEWFHNGMPPVGGNEY